MVDPTFHTGQMLQLFQIINRMVRISIVFGLGDTTGVAFALYGFSLKTADGSRRQNYRYGRLALMLQEQLNTREWDCRVLVYVYVLLNHWQEPLQKSLNPLLAAHSVGMETGDIDYAFQSAGAFLTLYWYSGVSQHDGVLFCSLYQILRFRSALCVLTRPLFISYRTISRVESAKCASSAPK